MKQDMYSSTDLQFLWLFSPSGLEQPALKWRLQLDQIKRIDLFRHNNAGKLLGDCGPGSENMNAEAAFDCFNVDIYLRI